MFIIVESEILISGHFPKEMIKSEKKGMCEDDRYIAIFNMVFLLFTVSKVGVCVNKSCLSTYVKYKIAIKNRIKRHAISAYYVLSESYKC